MQKTVIILSTTLLATAAHAQPAYKSMTEPLYVLRYGSTQGERGIWQYDVGAREYRFWQPLVGGNSLSAFEDRVVVLGPAAYEFDLATGRFLRRYPLLSGRTAWEFHGQIVPEKTASRLGIASGIYGFPFCASGELGPSCGTLQAPGYPDPVFATNYDLLLRRPIGPEDTQLRSAAGLTPMGGNPLSQRRFVGLARDALTVYSHGPTARIWMWGERITLLRPLGSLLSETITEQRQVDLRTPEYADPIASTYSTSEDAFIQTLAYNKLPTSETRLVARRSLQNSTTLDSSTAVYGASLPYALTVVPDELPDNYVQVIPAIGEARGANATDWRSDVWFFNPSSTEMTFTVRRVSRSPTQVQYTLPAHGSLKLARALSTLGGGAGGDGVTTDALVITSPYRWGEQLSAYSRTYTPALLGGTYGQAVPAVPSAVGYSTHLAEFIDYVDFTHSRHIPTTNSTFLLDLRMPGRFRHNFGAVNDLDRPVTIRLRLGTQIGFDQAPPGREQRVAVPAHSVANVSIENLFTKDVLDNNPPRVWVVADAPIPVWLSMVDNLSGDATFVPFELFDVQGSASRPVIVPAVTHTQGANQTAWKTDLYGIFTDFERGTVLLDQRATLISRQQCAGATRIDGLLRGVAGVPNVPDDGVLPFYYSIFPDVAAQFSSCDTPVTGALAMPRGSWMAGFTRTYTTREPDGATFGDMLPFYPSQGWPAQHFSGVEVSAQLRVNIGLFNAFEYPVRYDLRLYDAAGALIAQNSVTLAGNAGQQAGLSQFLGDIPQGTYGLTIMPQDSRDGPGRSWAYVSLVDNITGDPTNWW